MNICARFHGIRTAADHFYQFPTDLLILDYAAKHQIIASVKVGESFIYFLNNTKGPGPNRGKLLSWLLLCVWTRRSVFLWQGGGLTLQLQKTSQEKTLCSALLTMTAVCSERHWHHRDPPLWLLWCSTWWRRRRRSLWKRAHSSDTAEDKGSARSARLG